MQCNYLPIPQIPGSHGMRALLQDLRFAVRQFKKSPGFAFTTILTIALGIGGTTAIFSLVNTVLLRPLPFSEPDRIMSVASRNDRNPGVSGNVGNSMSYPDFFDWRSQNKSFSALASLHDNDFTLTGNGEPQHLTGEVVSADFFRVLGLRPALGRDFTNDDEKPGAHVVLLSHTLWESEFGSASDIVGRAITLDNKSYTVVGVMPKGFEFPIQNPAPVLWTSLGVDAYDPGGDPMTSERGAHLLDVIGRLKPEVIADQARGDLEVLARNLAARYPDTNRHFVGAVVTTELESLVGDTRPVLRILFGAVTFVLLIACANVAGLLLARSSRRRSEFAVRAALGASRSQIVRQMLVESVAIALCGGVAGLALATGLLRGLLRLVPSDVPRLGQVSVDGSVLAFAMAISVMTGLLFGVLPAWRTSRVNPSSAMRDGNRTGTTGRGQHRLQNSLVVAQTAIGLVLLVASGLLIHSFVRVLQVDPGFDRRNVLIASLSLPDSRYTSAQQTQFYQQLVARVRALPGVKSASAGWPLPLSQSGMRISFDIEGYPLSEGDRNTARVTLANPGYFATLRIPVLRGREFQDSDNAKATPVVIVSESFAQKYFSNEDPIGKHITPGLSDDTVKEVPREIIAVVGDVKSGGLKKDIAPEYYLPFAQAVVMSPRLVVRTVADPVALIAPLRGLVAEIDKNLPLYDVKTMDEMVSRSAAQPRFQAMLLTCFAAIALLLSAVGLYGLLSYLVVQRTLEIGVRIALGAQRGSVLGMFLRKGLMLAAIGLAIGIALSIALTRLMSGLLFGVRPTDPLTFVAVSMVLLLVSFLASSLPAYRASTLDPMTTLRDQ
jgi:putative ABC transport system permease protein